MTRSFAGEMQSVDLSVMLWSSHLDVMKLWHIVFEAVTSLFVSDGVAFVLCLLGCLFVE